MFLHVHVHTLCMHIQLNLQMILHTEKGHKNQIKIEEDTYSNSNDSLHIEDHMKAIHMLDQVYCMCVID